MRNGSTMSSAASACSTAALTPSALNECCIWCSTPLNTCGSRSHCSKPPKEERGAELTGWPIAIRDISVALIRDAPRIDAFCSRRPHSETFCLLDGVTAGSLHQSCGLELFDAGDVGFRPGALRLAGCEVERSPLVVDRARLAVDPAEAERLLHCGLVLDARLPRRLL